MKFIIDESWWSMLERASYRGGIGLFFNNTLTGIISYTLFAAFCICAAVGFIVIMKWIFSGSLHKSRETPGEYWRRTGRMK